MQKLFYLAPLLALLLIGCGRSPASTQREAEGCLRALIHELEQVHTKEDLEKRQAKLKEHFIHLADLMIRMEEKEAPQSPPSPLNDRLRDEMCRVYEIDGGRAIVEQSQREALHRIDTFPTLQKRRLKA